MFLPCFEIFCDLFVKRHMVTYNLTQKQKVVNGDIIYASASIDHK